MKVLVIKTSALGDVVHALPVLTWIKSADPDAQIHWLVEQSFAPVLEEHPLIDRVVSIDTKKWRKGGWQQGLAGFYHTFRTLRSEHYDVALDLQGNSKSGAFMLMSGARERYGFARNAVREWPALLPSNHKVSPGSEQYHVTERSLALARAAFPQGTQVCLAGPLAAAVEQRRDLENRLREMGLGARPLVILHYGTTWRTKLWALENWCVLARQLAQEEEVDLLLTWGNEEERTAAETIAEATAGRAIVWPRGSLKDLIALLERADLVVGCDTGPVHIAAAVGTSTVSLYRVTDARRNGPRGEHHRLLQVPLSCAVCLRKQCERDDECASAIMPEQVLKAIAELLEGMLKNDS